MTRRKTHLTSRKNKQTKYHANRATLLKEKKKVAESAATQERVKSGTHEAAHHKGTLQLEGYNEVEVSHDTGPSNDQVSSPAFLTNPQDTEKESINVCSLFDGIGTGYYVLHNILGLDVETYYSSEVDIDAIRVQKHNFGEKIVSIGPIQDLSEAQLKALGKVQLVIGASPCDQLSRVNWGRKGLYDKSGSGCLFFEFVRILNFFKHQSIIEGYKLFWFFENTYFMDKESKETISRALNCEPVTCCSSDYVPMSRKRYYWGNIPKMDTTHNTMKCRLELQNYLRAYMTALVKRVPTLTTNVAAQRSGPNKTLLAEFLGKSEYLSPIDYERLLGFYSHYTDCGLTHSSRIRLLGKSWSVHVVSSLLYPLKEIFQAAN